MEKYTFVKYSSSLIDVDPVFKAKSFSMFGNPAGTDDGPVLFESSYNDQRVRYCLIKPSEIIHSDERLLKLKRYLVFNNERQTPDALVNTFFIGNMEKSIDVSSGFYNQNIRLVTYEMIEQWYPHNLYDVFKLIIGYLLKKQKFFGEVMSFNLIDDDVLFVDPSLSDLEKKNYKSHLLRCMKEEKLVLIIDGGFAVDAFVLTAKATSLIEEPEENEEKSAFIAIKFDGNEERINVIQNAIVKSGFTPVIMSQLETNDWIMPEIFHQIEQSRFVVVDFSLKCDGAYYEAGYAAALNKPVIHLFDKREIRDDNKLHFDIAQKSTIFYENYKDLTERLVNRIKATIK